MVNPRFTASLAAAACLAAAALSAPAASAESTAVRSTDSIVQGLDRHEPLSTDEAAAQRSLSAMAVTLDRIAGQDRYLTAVEISKAHFPDGTWPKDPDHPDDPAAPVDSVVIASGFNYPDALAGGPFAAGIGPLLLVPGSGTVPAAVAAEIQRLQPKYVFILGGTGAVSAGIESQLQPLGEVHRVNGSNRYHTAGSMGKTTAASIEGGVDTVVLASGEDFADSLAGGASAATQGGVLLLTLNKALSPETKDALKVIAPKKVQLLGGKGVVSDAVLNAVKAAVPGVTVQRVAGADRAATAAALSKVTFPKTADATFFAHDANYPDALAAAPVAWFWGASVLLSRTPCAPSSTIAEDARLTPPYRIALGGTGVVSDAALNLKKC